jgi:hypothetical protein
MTILHASPYNPDARGFNFSTAEDFTIRASALRDRFGAPVEEFSIEYLDGDDSKLFEACKINQTNLDVWFDDIETLEDYEKAALFYLVDQAGYDLSDAMSSVDDVTLYAGRLIDAATELFDECYLPEVPEAVRNYIDYESFANDCRLGGDMCEFRIDGTTWTVTNASDV